MLTHAFLTVTTTIQRRHAPAPTGLIDLTVAELRRHYDALLLTTHHSLERLLAWSTWRRQHQATARHHHYRHRQQQ